MSSYGDYYRAQAMRSKVIFEKLTPPLYLDSKKASIHTHPDHPGDVIKAIPIHSLGDRDRASKEAELLKKASEYLDNISTFQEAIMDNENSFFYIRMRKVKGMTLADFYGAEIEKIPDFVWNKVKEIVKKLYFIGIEYADVTPYNFMIDDDGEVYVIDFGHAYGIIVRTFVKKMLNESGFKSWNDYFR